MVFGFPDLSCRKLLKENLFTAVSRASKSENFLRVALGEPIHKRIDPALSITNRYQRAPVRNDHSTCAAKQIKQTAEV